MDQFDFTSKHSAPGDQYFAGQAQTTQVGERNELATVGAHPMDQEPARKRHRQLLEWYYLEREKQSLNRMEMAMDADYYDNIQWDPDDEAELRNRGQMPLVYNEVAPMCDWLIGTERRTRVDWKVLPRTEDDVKAADIKTKTLKYVADVNRTQFVRSCAFADAIKAGVGWVDDGARDDPTKDILYSQYEDWRRVLWDSASYDLALEDARYIFRWRWVDEDIAVMMIPDRADQIRRAMNDAHQQYASNFEEDEWYRPATGQIGPSGQLYASGTGIAAQAKRRQVKLIEAQYRIPVRTKVIASGPLKGALMHPHDNVLADALGRVGGSIIDKVVMRVHVAVFTEGDMLADGLHIYRHNRFSLTPIWCYRRGRDRLPYGVIRRVRDIQQDLNKRASKALFLLNTNQIVVDEGAVEDLEVMRDEAGRPDGVIVKKKGYEVNIRRDTDAATGQIQMMTLDGQSIQKSGGVSQENMGRQTNAVSGEAIRARQNQGSVVTTEPFDNLRLGVQCQGEKQLSNVEQFYSEEKVIRLTGAKGAIDWVYVNKTERQPDGSIRYLNDITESMADFIVADQDYAGTLRQVMFESLNAMAVRLDPQVAMRVMTIAMEFSDLPNKDEIVEQFRKLTGERDPNKEMTPEEQQQAQDQLQQQSEAMQLQREAATTALEEQRAKVRQINAQAAKLEAEAGGATQQGGLPPELERQIRQVQEQAATQIDQLSKQLAKAQSDAANKTLAINKDADTKVETARITASATVQAAEIQAASDKKIQALIGRLDDLTRLVGDAQAEAEKAAKGVEKIANAPAPRLPAAAAPGPAPVAGAPMNLTINVDAKGAAVKKTIVMQHDSDGNTTGATIQEVPVKSKAKE